MTALVAGATTAPAPATVAAAPPARAAGGGVPLRDWVGFMAMVVGMFMAILDIQIVASSLAEIRAGLNAGPDEISWVQTAYLIAEVIMIPLSGWLARVFSTRWLFAGSCATFTLASAACALAWDIPSMVAFRVVQGFLGGAMIPTVFATSFRLFPPRLTALVTVMVGLTATMAPTLGPTIGGWITQSLSWPWLFLVNLVPGLVVTVLVVRLVRVDRPNLELLRGFDLAGIVLVALFLGSLQFVLEEGPGDDWFEDSTIVLFAVVSAIAGLLFLWRELAVANPVVDLRAFADRNFLVGCFYSFVIGVGLYGTVYVVPVYLGGVRHYNSLDIGITMMVVGAFQMLSAPVAGALSKHMDQRLMLALGLSLFGVGLWLNAAMTADWGFDEFFLPQAVRGLSLMLCFLPINTIALGTLSHDRLPNASGLYNLMRNLGGAIGLAVINTLLDSRHDLHLTRLAEGLNGPAAVAWLDGAAARLGPRLGAADGPAALRLLAEIARREATVMTFNDVFLLLAGLFGIALLLMPLVRKVDPAADGGAGH